MKNMRKIFTLVLALAMVMSLAGTALAVDTATPPTTYSITIKNANATEEHIYEVYQLFTGLVLEGTLPSTDILSDVEWGTGVASDKITTLIQELKNAEINPLFAAKYNAKESDTEFQALGTAAQVAEILAENSTNFELVKEFSHTVCKYLSTEKIVLTASEDNKTYSGAGFVGGYYLIKDKDNSLTNDAETYTSNILQVVGNTEVNAKSGTVTPDKNIVDGTVVTEATDYNVGDVIDFELSGTIPENYNRFAKFYYAFVDTMSAGLTYVENSVRVYIQNNNNPVELTTGWTASCVGNVLKVEFENLKAITDRTIDSHSQIIVKYQAILNQNAVVGEPGNPNTLHIEFSNNPYNEQEHGKTPEDKVHVFTFGLNINKVDGGNDAAPLAGAKFVMWRMSEGDEQYLLVDENGKVTGWTPYLDQSEIEADENDPEDAVAASVMVSGDDGLVAIAGLEADTYYLKEVEAPAGYNKIEDTITVNIYASVSETDDGTEGQVDSLSIVVNGGNSNNGNLETGEVDMNVINNQGSTLPETGGIGTTIFYLLGGIMVAAAVVILVTKKRMASEA